MKLLSFFSHKKTFFKPFFTFVDFIFASALLGSSSTTVTVDKLVDGSQNPVSLKNAADSSYSIWPKKIMTCIYLNVVAFCDEV